MTYRVPENDDLPYQSPENLNEVMDWLQSDCMSEDADTAQTAFVHYFEVLGYYLALMSPSSNRAPIGRLHDAFVDLLNGVPNDLLKVRKRPGRPRTSYAAMETLITASALITSLIGSGKSEEEAARHVTRRLKKFELPLPRSQPTKERQDWERLQDWRDQLSNGTKGEWAKSEYNYQCFIHMVYYKQHGEKADLVDKFLGRLK